MTQEWGSINIGKIMKYFPQTLNKSDESIFKSLSFVDNDASWTEYCFSVIVLRFPSLKFYH